MRSIINANTIPVNQVTGTIPDVSGALKDRFQLMTFETVSKSVVNFQVVETPSTISFWGHIQVASDNALRMLPEGQRTQWQYFTLHAEPATVLKPDEVVLWNGIQYRIFSRKDFSIYGYLEFLLVTDWTGSGP